jgi:hypothetical protein
MKLDPQKALLAFAAGVALLASAGIASAATISNVEYSNGDVTIQGNAGQSVSGKVRIVVGNNEEVEYVQFDVISDNLSPVCANVNRLQEGTHFVNIPGDVKFPPNTGTYNLSVSSHGIFGGLAADDCVGDQNGSNSFNNSVRTVGGSTSSGSVGTVDSLLAVIAGLQAQFACMTNGGNWNGITKACDAKPAPVASTKCAAIAPFKFAPAGTYSDVGVQLQATLLADNPNSIPALKAGSTVPMGYRGPQTENALSMYNAKHACN